MLFITDELDAVNAILASIGESPINTLVDAESVDVDNAQRTLENVSRRIQRRGWQFNTRLNEEVLPDVNTKRIKYNPTWMNLKADDGKTYVKRGDFVYNLSDKTYTFENNLTVSIIEAVDFGDLPDEFKQYITCKAAVEFQARYLGDDNISQELMQELAEAYADIVQYSIDTGTNMMQTTGMQEALERT